MTHLPPAEVPEKLNINWKGNLGDLSEDPHDGGHVTHLSPAEMEILMKAERVSSRRSTGPTCCKLLSSRCILLQDAKLHPAAGCDLIKLNDSAPDTMGT